MITVSMITTKPTDIQWWFDLNPDKMTAIVSYIKTLPGFVSYTATPIDVNSRKQEIVFENIGDYLNYESTRTSWHEWQERNLYNNTNKIFTEISETIS